jgi:hypothetical protein
VLWLFTNWKLFAGFAGALALAWVMHTAHVSVLERRHEAAMAEQSKTFAEQCAQEKKITQEVSRDYQTKISQLRTDLAAVSKRLRQTMPNMQPTDPTGGRDAAPSRPKYVAKNGADIDALVGFAAEAEGYRLQLTACQQFIAQTWAARGQ